MSALQSWIKERYDLQPLIAFMEKKKVPAGPGWIWYYMGGVALFLFVVQVISGILLLMYYKATATEAFESIQFIMSKVQFGGLIRSVHSWSANFMVLAAFVHMFSVLFHRSYAKPRELTWVTGMVLLLLSMAFGFSGYLLPWNELALAATKVGTEIAGAVPIIGKAMLIVLRGGEDVTGATLPRFFGFHVAIFPLIFVVFLGIHLILIQVQGMSTPHHWAKLPEKERKFMPFFPNFVLRDLLLWLIVLNILAVFAVFFPWELGTKADLFAPAPANLQPEWYFMFMFQTLKLIPPYVLFMEGEIVGILGFMLGGFIWIILPFMDRKDDEKHFRFIKITGVVVIIYIAIMTVWGYM